MRILVTGGTGFIGTSLVKKLSKHEISVVSRHKSRKNKYYLVDITNKKNLGTVFSKERPEYVFHLAAQVNPRLSMEKPIEDTKVNLFGTMNVLDMCRKYDTRKIIFSSTSAVYGEPRYLPVDEKHETLPISIYGASKLTAEKYTEMYCNAYGIKYTILRYANVYGPGSRSVISIFVKNIIRKKSPMIFGDGNQTRDYIYIDDIVRATILAIKNADNLKLNIGTGKEASIKNIVSIISKQLESSIKPIYKPEKKGEIKKIFLDVSIAKKYLKWKPLIDVNSGIKKLVSAN